MPLLPNLERRKKEASIFGERGRGERCKKRKEPDTSAA